MSIIKSNDFATWIGYKHFFRFMIGKHSGFSFYVSIDGKHFFQYRTGLIEAGGPGEVGEVCVWQFGQFMIVRPETNEEVEEREYAWEEQNYQDWCADYYSY